MGEIGAEDLVNWDKLHGMGSGIEEKIFVLVRLRPLSDKEILRNEVVDWECINSTTILYRNSLQERSGLPTAYSFDRVFRGDNSTREVYGEGIKDIALSVVGGINSTIFAYGQTSSGKTYTMNGITECTVADIYDYIERHEERAFVLKFSAMEIYNEVVRDLICADNTALRLLDDPEKGGTIIEKLTEETLRDQNHLKELLSICEAQRQIGETLLNETSSRSHQILRLTIESSALEFIGKGNSTTLAACVNFVDLAGSERASQALSVGQRLKEGCHINRSLLTLGTVIRKLSKGRHGHVNYRDSKLTRILQPALGGNARASIICTLSPSRNHVEQSRNTLLFASCAKEVSTNAQVNVVMSDKALVKQLQKEVARLENELRTPGSICDHATLLRKKDMQIEKLERENRELKKQLDLAHSRIDDLLHVTESYKGSQEVDGVNSVDGGSICNRTLDPLEPENSRDNFSSDSISILSQETENPLLGSQEGFDGISEEARRTDLSELDKDKANELFAPSTSESEESVMMLSESGSDHIVTPLALSALPRQLHGNINGCLYSELEQKIRGVQNTIDSLFRPYPDIHSPRAASADLSVSRSSNLTRSRSCRASLISSSGSEMAEQNETTPPTVLGKNFSGRPITFFPRQQWKFPPVIYGANGSSMLRNDSQSFEYSSFIDESTNEVSSQGDEDIPTLGSFVAGLRELAKTDYEYQPEQQRELTDEANAKDRLDDWPVRFDKLQRQIIELWQACNVSLVHRTYFFLLNKEDLSHSIYMEVEHRRLSFLKETFSRGNSALQDGRAFTLTSSKKALHRERKMLSRLMYKRYTVEERNRIYGEWGITLNSKRRRLQLFHRLWSYTESMDHITNSAAIVARLIGFFEHELALEEILGLSFAPPQQIGRRSFSWKTSMASLL